jgi:hypothetical protein
MRFSDSIKNIAEALCKVQAKIKNPIKTAVNKGVQGAPKYALLEDTLDDIRPVLAKHGMSFTQGVEGDGLKVGVKTVLFHSSGEFIEGDAVYCEVEIPISKEGKKILTQGQATGVNITYLRRYSLNAALGITGDADTDGSLGDLPTITPETAKDFEITFGKHKGKTIQQIFAESPDYLDWLLGSEKTADDVKSAISIYFSTLSDTPKEEPKAPEPPKDPEPPKEPQKFNCSICGKEMTEKYYMNTIKNKGVPICSAECLGTYEREPDKYTAKWKIEG